MKSWAFALVLLLAATSDSVGQSPIPAVAFICTEKADLLDILVATSDEGRAAGRERAAHYTSTGTCWGVDPTLVEVLKIEVEIVDQAGETWALVLVRPHPDMGFTNPLNRYAVLSADIARKALDRGWT